MLLQLTSTSQPATDLGYLLHKNPSNLHKVELSVGTAYVYYTRAENDRCTACLLLDIDSVDLVRGGQQLEAYVNDRPYSASSYFSVAIGRSFGTALAGNCQRRPELVTQKLQLEISLSVIRSNAGAARIHELFTPLGYEVEAKQLPLDPKFPEWGLSPYFEIQLRAQATVHDVLSHLYVLLPVLDAEKHYFVDENEVSKLIRHGEGWLKEHPLRDSIVTVYLKRKTTLIGDAIERLLANEPASEAIETESEQSSEEKLEEPITLHAQRLIGVVKTLKELGARSVLDLGCGEGKLIQRLLSDPSFEKIVGVDISHRSLERAAEKLHYDKLSDFQRSRVQLRHGSLLYRDRLLEGFDAAALVEVIEHLDLHRLRAMERVLFEFAKPRYVVVTTPNRDYNSLFPALSEGSMRHQDHRFEWTRTEFTGWAQAQANRFGYNVEVSGLGPLDETLGSPTQMAVFQRGIAA